jgi:hypothetical protein
MAGLLARIPSTLEGEAGEVLVATLRMSVLGLMGTFQPFTGWVRAWFGREQRAWRCVRTVAWGEAISRHTSACISVIVVLQSIVPTKLIR